MIEITYLAPLLASDRMTHAGKAYSSSFTSVASAPDYYHHRHGTGSYESLSQFCDELKITSEVTDDPKNTSGRVFIIRGKVKQEFASKAKIRRTYVATKDNPNPNIEPNDCRWICLDVDNACASIALDDAEARRIWRSWSTEEKTAYLHKLIAGLGLPEWLTQCDFIAQTSSSALLSAGIWKGHLWWFLNRPIMDATWKRILPKTVDHALFQPVQPHYIASPIFYGCEDPLKDHRIIYVNQSKPIVEVPASIPTPEEEVEAAHKAAVIRRKNAEIMLSANQGVDRSHTATGIDKWARIVAKINACDDGSRHPRFWAIYHEMNCLVQEGWVSPSKWKRFRSLWLEICPNAPWSEEKVDSMMNSGIQYNESLQSTPLPTLLSPTPTR